MKYYIGCSGFSYDHWIGNFYPPDLPRKEWLEFYTERFNSVEINSTFYHLPKEATMLHWYERVPADFRFTLKASRYITHQKGLVDVAEPVKNFYTRAFLLKEKLGCILWQIPGGIHRDIERLDSFCRGLSVEFRNVIEFRHNSWFDDTVYDILEKHRVTFCIISAPEGLSDAVLRTTDSAYGRFHGRDAWYCYHYGGEELYEWAERLKALNPSHLFVYFNNDFRGFAPENAETFRCCMEKNL